MIKIIANTESNSILTAWIETNAINVPVELVENLSVSVELQNVPCVIELDSTNTVIKTFADSLQDILNLTESQMQEIRSKS
jgi:glyceraldehyde-3-phosphate dehydrogenase/erythrose-4-phosphate dehydrogenase